MSKKSDSFVKKFWNGDVSMVKSFWIFNIIIDQVQIAIFAFIIIMNSLPMSLILLFVAPYKVWVITGTMRSSYKYKGKQVWSTFVRIYIIGSILYLMAKIIRPLLM